MAQRTVLVTGASSGIGRALALEFARRGAHVAVSARRENELEQVAAGIREQGGRALVLPVDVTDAPAVREMVRRADMELGALDTVVANAGVGHRGHASTTTWEEIERTIDVNLRGAMATIHAAIPIFLAHKGGHIVGVTSLAGRRGLPRSGPYAATKAALSTYLESLRLDLHDANIRVTDVQPGFVDTEMMQGATHPMPFRWSADRAARHIAKKLERGPAMIAFPWPLVWVTRMSRHMPAWLYDRTARTLAT